MCVLAFSRAPGGSGLKTPQNGSWAFDEQLSMIYMEIDDPHPVGAPFK